jgi:hypothetical protein
LPSSWATSSALGISKALFSFLSFIGFPFNN